ncbi:mRNA splicing factor RNA helicase, partial [Coccidioides posadasii str. Silveira]
MDTRTYVSDSLLRLTGASDPTVIDFILATTSSAKSPTLLREKLEPFLDASAGDIESFVSELWSRAGLKGSAGKSEKRNKPDDGTKKRYRLVEMEDGTVDHPGLGPTIDVEKSRRRDKSERNGDSRRQSDREDKRKRDRDGE